MRSSLKGMSLSLYYNKLYLTVLKEVSERSELKLIVSQSTFEKNNDACIMYFLTLLLLSCISFYTISGGVLTCDILGIGLFQVQYLFKTIIYSSVRMNKII